MRLECSMAHQQQHHQQPVQSKIIVESRSRDIRRRIDVIQKKIADLQDLGVPCAFTYTSARNTGSIFTVGDSRVTDVIERHKNEILKNLMDNEAGEGGHSTNEIHMILPPLPAPLEELNRTSLQSLITGILKDLGLRWTDPQPNWWPPEVPFVAPRSSPENFSGSWTQALKRILESVYSYFSYDVNTYIASSLSRSPPATEAAATVNESSDDTSMHYGDRSLPIETNSSGASNSKRFHHGSTSSSSDDCSSTVAKGSGGPGRTAASGSCTSPSLEESRWSDQSSSSSRKQPNKSISSFTVENILMGRQRSSSSSDSPTTTMSESFSTTPPPISGGSGISVSTVSSSSGGSNSSNHSSVVGTNWVSHPPVKYTKFTMLSPTSMADETQKRKKTDSVIEVQWRDSGNQETAQGSLSSSIDLGRELKRVPSNLRGSMDLLTSFPVTQKPKSFSRSSSSGTPSTFFHRINATSSSSSQSQQQQNNFPTQNLLQTATKVSSLPVVQAVPTAPDAKTAVLHQTFPPSGQQVVLLIPSNSTSIAGSVPTIFYANPVLSLSQSATTTASPSGVAKLTAVAPISTSTAVAYNSTAQGSDLGSISPSSSMQKRHTAIDEAAQPPHNQSPSESPHRPIAPKTSTTATPAAAPESVDGKNSDKMKLYLKRTMPKPPKLRFHMTTVMKQPTGNTVMTSLTAQSPQAIVSGETAGSELHGSLSAAGLSENEQQHFRSDVAMESTITRSPNVYSNESTPLQKPPTQQPPQRVVIAAAMAPWTTVTTTKQEPDSDGSSPTQRHSPQTNGAISLTMPLASGSDTANTSSTTTTKDNSKNGTIAANKTPQTAVLKDSGFHLQLVKQQSGGSTGDMNTNNSPPQPQLQNTVAKREQETSSSAHSGVQKSGRQNGRQSGPGRGRGRATRSYTRRKRELTFHLYEDPSTAFRAKRPCRDKE